MTQVEFAAGVGITPASVYRYEVATADPSAETLLKLLKFANAKNDAPAEFIFKNAYYERTGGWPFKTEDLINKDSHSSRPPVMFLQALAAGLEDEDLAVLYATIALLKEKPKNDTALNVLRTILAPFLPRAETELRTANAIASPSVSK
jgi:transcriptional regulator with XRE-family HTH domain